MSRGHETNNNNKRNKAEELRTRRTFFERVKEKLFIVNGRNHYVSKYQENEQLSRDSCFLYIDMCNILMTAHLSQFFTMLQYSVFQTLS